MDAIDLYGTSGNFTVDLTGIFIILPPVDRAAAGSPSAEAVCTSVCGASSPRAGAPRSGPLHQNRYDDV